MNFLNPVSPPEWSLAVGTAGRGFIWLAIAAFVTSLAAWLFSSKHPLLSKLGKWSFGVGAVSILGAFASLATLFATARLEYDYVWGHSDSTYGLGYRIAGIWSGQEGSFLLWASAAAVFGLLSMRGTGDFRRWYTIFYSFFVGSLAGILAFESPFKLILGENGQPIVPGAGVGMSPALLNYWVTIHPPVIFLGFGALTVLAAFGFAALATNRLQEWAAPVRPWAILAATLTGVGLCMGGFWAYETLGWGGFWMWDPVENVSFVPWVMCLALVHGLIVQVTRKRWVQTNLLLAGLPFLLFVYGTFLTRSGVLSDTSVHSFAEMNGVALKLLLGFMALSSGIYLGMWGWRALQYRKSAAKADVDLRGIHREGFYRLGVTMLILTGLLAAIGMSVPMIMSLMGKKAQTVDEALYNKTLAWVYVPLMLAMAVGVLSSWRALKLKAFFNRVYGVVCVTFVAIGLAMVAAAATPLVRGIGAEAAVTLPFGLKVGAVPWVVFLASLSVGALISSAWRMIETVKGSKLAWGAFLSHVGVAVLMAGLIVSRGLERKEQLFVSEGGHNGALGYMIMFKGNTSTLNDRENKIRFEMVKDHDKWIAEPGFYYAKTQDGRENPVATPYIKRYPFHDIYFSLSPRVEEASDVMMVKPGETVSMDRFTVTHLGNTRSGEFGSNGTKFGVKLRIAQGHNSMVVNPAVEIGGPNGLVEHPAKIGKGFLMVMKSMDAASGGAALQLKFQKPLYPVEVFYKPLTGLIWFGTALMMIAGFMSAWYRRIRAKVGAPAPEQKEFVDAERELVATR